MNPPKIKNVLGSGTAAPLASPRVIAANEIIAAVPEENVETDRMPTDSGAL